METFTSNLKNRIELRARTSQEEDMKSRLAVMMIVMAASFLVIRGQAFAHHGVSAYDVLHPVTIKGTVTEFVLQNPHSMLFMDVKDNKGKVVHWSIETQAPAAIKAPGGLKNMLKPGDVITVTLVAAKSGAPVGFCGYNVGRGTIVRADGSVICIEGCPGDKPDNSRE
jgi:hypothetical protein